MTGKALVEAASGRVDPQHLIDEHGMDRAVVTSTRSGSRHATRHATLWLEMKHAADHAQRRVGHEHN